MKRLLVVTALPAEFKIVKQFMKNQEIISGPFKRCKGSIDSFPVEVVMTSMGMKAAKKACQEIMTSEEHGGALVLGYCGGLTDKMKVGDIVVPFEVFDSDLNSIKLDSQLSSLLGQVHGVGLVTSPVVVSGSSEKKALHQKTRGDVVDMESFEVIKTALEKGMTGVIIKIVIDDLNTLVPQKPPLSLELLENIKRANQIFEKGIPSYISTICRYWNF